MPCKPTPKELIATGAIAALAVGAGAVARPRLRNLGATRAERLRALPGDGLIPGERATSTMATTIPAPPSAVWPWLAQMGADRAGWYSFDRLDNGGRASATELRPEWAAVAEGDRFVTVPGRSWFDVAHVEPERSLILRATLDGSGRAYDPRAGRPCRFVDSRWEFFLEPADDGAATRLLVRSGGVSGPRPLTDIIDMAFFHPAHVVMQLRQFRGLRRRATAPAAA